MRKAIVATLGGLSLLASEGAFAADCPTAYEKTIPYTQPVFDDQTSIEVHNTVTLRYDCKTFLLGTEGGLHAQFFAIDADLISAKVTTDNTRDGAHLSTSVLAMGYEISHDERDVKEVYNQTFHPDQDLDVSQVKNIQLGPITVPVRYGIHGTAEANVSLGMRKLGSELVVTPAAKISAYVLANIDVQLIQASARGELALLDGALTNTLGVHFSPSKDTPTIDFSATGDLNLQGLDGAVTAALTHPDEDGKTVHEEAELFRWSGVSQQQQVYQHADQIAALPPR